MKVLGRCAYSKSLVMLLEPTKKSDATIHWIDFFLRVAANGLLNADNTAIINCRAFFPNAAYKE